MKIVYKYMLHKINATVINALAWKENAALVQLDEHSANSCWSWVLVQTLEHWTIHLAVSPTEVILSPKSKPDEI